MKIKIGTRGSRLALWQAEMVQKSLQQKGVDTEIVVIETKGDKILDVTIAKIGSKGVFTEEIEDQLREGSIDIAVHSAKDMQSSLPKGFEIIAFSEREKSHDVLVGKKAIDLNSDQLVLGTSSTRRISFLNKYYPKVKTIPVRGNLQTRIKKMEEGVCDALWLAYAGTHRMGYDPMIIHEFDETTFITAVGQGSVAIEVYETLSEDKRQVVREAINHENTETCLHTERAFLKTMDGGCSIPVYAKATLIDDVLTITGGIISLDGQQQITKKCTSVPYAAKKTGQALASSVLKNGGKEILEEIKKSEVGRLKSDAKDQ